MRAVSSLLKGSVLTLLVARFGLEGLVTFKRDNDYDADSYEIHVPTPSGKNVTIGVFDKVEVEISVEKVRLAALSIVNLS